MTARARWRSLCVECGPNVKVDEDGLCCGCGATCMGAWLEKHGARLALALEKHAAKAGRNAPNARAPRKRRAQPPSGYAADLMEREARASVALDLEGDVHTCHDECQRPGCVKRRAKAAKPRPSRRKGARK